MNKCFRFLFSGKQIKRQKINYKNHRQKVILEFSVATVFFLREEKSGISQKLKIKIIIIVKYFNIKKEYVVGSGVGHKHLL